jgi:protein-serine/threonine kinase
VSIKACTLITILFIFLPSLICGREQRLVVEQIKQHPFFYGVDWESIRHIESPFIPDLRSITDTSYFPTEDLESVPDVPAGADIEGKNKDLAFLG